MTAIVEFYTNNGKTSEGKTLEEILEFSANQLEQDHLYIQWIFPIDQPSIFNQNAPVLTANDIVQLVHNKNFSVNFQKSFQLFWLFLTNNTHIWVKHLNHNHYRITRMIRSATLFGFDQLTKEMLSYLLKINKENENIFADPINYWLTANRLELL